MSQRVSGYVREERDCYETPEWVTESLLPHLQPGCSVWEPACGSGLITKALEKHGYRVVATDVVTGHDFFNTLAIGWQVIVTNPPFGLAQKFIERALDLTRDINGVSAMLLRTDYDHAKTRQHLFGQCRQFARKLVLTKRIVWFERPGAAPSFNHAWFIWDWKHRGLPVLAYGP